MSQFRIFHSYKAIFLTLYAYRMKNGEIAIPSLLEAVQVPHALLRVPQCGRSGSKSRKSPTLFYEAKMTYQLSALLSYEPKTKA